MNQTILRATILGLALVSTTACKKKQPEPDNANQPAIEGNFFAEGFSEQSIAGNLATAKPAVEFGERCTGFVGEEPVFTFTIPDALPMRISAVADVDTSLVIEGPEGPHCNDDYKDQNPSIAQVWPAGEYRLWLGSYEAQSEPFFYEVNFEHFDPEADEEPVDPFANLNADAPRATEATAIIDSETANDELLAESNDAAIGTYHLAPRAAATPIEFNVTFDERQAASAIHENCGGFINYAAPDFILAFTGGGPLNIVAIAETDTTLLVRSEHGVWCADDVLDANPAIQISDAPEGKYAVYIGTETAEQTTAAGELTIY